MTNRERVAARLRAMLATSNPPPNPYDALGPGPHNTGSYLVPGIGEWGREKNSRKYARNHPELFPDGPRHPRGRGPFTPKSQRAQRGRKRTRPTPGSAYNRGPKWD